MVGLKAKVKPFLEEEKHMSFILVLVNISNFAVTNELQNVLCKLEQIQIERQTENKKFSNTISCF